MICGLVQTYQSFDGTWYLSQVSSNVKRKASDSFRNLDEFIQEHKTSNFQRHRHDNLISCADCEGNLHHSLLSIKSTWKKNRILRRKKAVFIKFETACVGRFYYPPRTSDLVDPSLRLAHSITRNEAERTPLRRGCVIVSTDKNLRTAPFIGRFALPNLLTFHEWASTLIWESFLYVKDFICPLLSRNVESKENKTTILPFVLCTVVPVYLNSS